MEAEFNLRRLVRDVRTNSTLVDPHSIAREVLHRIDDRNLREALSDCLAAFVREYLRDSRNSAGTPWTAAPTQRPPLARAGETKPVRGGKPKPIAHSAKVTAIRAAAPSWMKELIHTGADPREWKRIGDCTVADLMFAAASRREQAQRTNAKAAEYEALAQLLQVHGVQQVRDLPADALHAIGGAAA